MSENSDYDEGPWQGHDFKKARQDYQKHAKERVQEAAEKKISADALIPESVITYCQWPLFFFTDVTGSIGERWLEMVFSKFPYFFYEGKIYMCQELEVCLAAIGDLYPPLFGGRPDEYFFQIVNPVKADAIMPEIKRLIPEKGGGGQSRECYELAATYALHNIFFPNAIRKPLLIFIGDERPYDTVSVDIAKRVNVNLQRDMTTDEIFEALKKRFTVYMVRKPYNSYEEHDIHMRWIELLGESRVCVLKTPDRIVDVSFGIMAKESRKIPYFIDEITGRQTKEQCEEVLEALEPIFDDPTPDDAVLETESDEGKDTSPLV